MRKFVRPPATPRIEGNSLMVGKSRGAPVCAQCGSRISGQSDHGSEGLSAIGRRAARRDEARPGHVRQDRRARSADAGRTPTVSCRRVAEGLRDYSEARPETERTAEAWLERRG